MGGDAVLQGLFTGAVLAIVAGVFLLPVILVLRRQRQSEVEPLDLREPLPPEGVKVPVVETSAGWGIRGSGTTVLPSDNSLSPLLRLSTDHVEYRVIVRRRASYDQIVRVDGGGEVNAWLAIHLEGGRSLGVRLAAADRNAVAKFLATKGVALDESLARLIAVDEARRRPG